MIIRAALSPSPMGVGTPGCLQQVKPPGAGFFRFRGVLCWGCRQAQPRGGGLAMPPVVVRDALSPSPMGVGTPARALASRGAQCSCRVVHLDHQHGIHRQGPHSPSSHGWFLVHQEPAYRRHPFHTYLVVRGSRTTFAGAAMAHCNALKVPGKSLFELALIGAESSAPRIAAKIMSVHA